MTDFDPAMVPIRAAATVLLIADRPELKILMMRRHAKTLFAGGMWVFPGGAVDPADVTVAVSGRSRARLSRPDHSADPRGSSVILCRRDSGMLRGGGYFADPPRSKRSSIGTPHPSPASRPQRPTQCRHALLQCVVNRLPTDPQRGADQTGCALDHTARLTQAV